MNYLQFAFRSNVVIIKINLIECENILYIIVGG